MTYDSIRSALRAYPGTLLQRGPLARRPAAGLLLWNRLAALFLVSPAWWGGPPVATMPTSKPEATLPRTAGGELLQHGTPC
jgi:hypothetical protein